MCVQLSSLHVIGRIMDLQRYHQSLQLRSSTNFLTPFSIEFKVLATIRRIHIRAFSFMRKIPIVNLKKSLLINLFLPYFWRFTSFLPQVPGLLIYLQCHRICVSHCCMYNNNCFNSQTCCLENSHLRGTKAFSRNLQKSVMLPTLALLST